MYLCVCVYLRVLDLSAMFVAMNLDSFASYLYKPHSAKHTYESTVKQNNRSFHMLVIKTKHLLTKCIYTCTRRCLQCI